MLEGALRLDAIFPGGLPASVEVAMAAYASPDGGALQGQAPAGDGDGHLEAAEFVSMPLYAAGTPSPSAVVPRLAAWPVPFNAQVRLAVTGLPDGPATVMIHDARGRAVRRLVAEVRDGRGELAWDGRDDAGRDLPSGVYYARAAGAAGPASGTAVARLVLVK